MKKVLLAVLFFTACSWALDDKTVPYTFSTRDTIKASRLNANFDTLETWIARTNDSLELRFARFADVKDSTFQRVNCDSIRSNPDVDSIQGHPWIDTITTGKVTATQADINGGTVDGVIIGGASAQAATVTTLTASSTASVDSLFSTKGIKATTAILSGVVSADSVYAAHVGIEATFPCTLTGVTTTVTGTAKYVKIGNVVTLVVPGNLFGTSNANTMTVTGLPAAIIPTYETGFYTAYTRDNGANEIALAHVSPNPSPGVVFSRYINPDYLPTNWTNSGSKGIGTSFIGLVLHYYLK